MNRGEVYRYICIWTKGLGWRQSHGLSLGRLDSGKHEQLDDTDVLFLNSNANEHSTVLRSSISQPANVPVSHPSALSVSPLPQELPLMLFLPSSCVRPFSGVTLTVHPSLCRGVSFRCFAAPFPVPPFENALFPYPARFASRIIGVSEGSAALRVRLSSALFNLNPSLIHWHYSSGHYY